MIKIAIIFLIIQLISITLHALERILVIKSGKLTAAIFAGISYMVYVIVIRLIADTPLYISLPSVFLANLIGIFLARTLYEKLKKDSVWYIRCFGTRAVLDQIVQQLETSNIKYNHSKDLIICSSSQRESIIIKKILDNHYIFYTVETSDNHLR